MLVPIRNFAEVDADKKLFRSAQPEFSYEFKFIKEKLGVDTIVNLRNDRNNRDQFFSSKFGLKSVSIPMQDDHSPTLEQARAFIELVKNGRGILFHCEHGHGRTSLFCVLARIAMGWKLQPAIDEETKVFGYEFHHQNQLDFLRENFSNN